MEGEGKGEERGGGGEAEGTSMNQRIYIMVSQ